MKTLRQLLKEGEQRLLENQIENSTMEARYLLEYICDLNWAQYLLQADTEADPQEERRYQGSGGTPLYPLSAAVYFRHGRIYGTGFYGQ